MASLPTPPQLHWTHELEVIDIDAYAVALQMHHNDSVKPFQQKSLTESSRRRGRKMNDETPLLNSFVRMKNHTFKKDNLRTKIIRAHKKCLREMMSVLHHAHPKPKKSRRKLAYFHEATTPGRYEKWLQLFQLCRQNPEHFAAICQTSDGPKNDEHTQSKKEGRFLSYSNACCSAYFEAVLTQESFLAFLELVFEERSCAELCTVFAGKCCLKPEHSSACISLWQRLKLFLSDTFCGTND